MKPSGTAVKHPGRRHPQPVLHVEWPYPWKILAERPKNTNWHDVFMQLKAYFKDPTHPDYKQKEDARASVRRGRKRQPPPSSARRDVGEPSSGPPEGDSTGLRTSSPSSTGPG